MYLYKYLMEAYLKMAKNMRCKKQPILNKAPKQ